MDKETFRKKIKKGIAEYLADPVIKKRLAEMYKRKREARLLTKF